MNAARYCAVCAWTGHILSWSYDPARAIGLVEGLRNRAIACTLEIRT